MLTELEQITPETILLAVHAAGTESEASSLHTYISRSLGLPFTNLAVARKTRDVLKELIDAGHVRKTFSSGYSPGVRPCGRTTYTLTDQGKGLFEEIYGVQ